MYANRASVHFCHIQRKRKMDELVRKLDESEKKRKVTSELIAKAKIGKDETVCCISLILWYDSCFESRILVLKIEECLKNNHMPFQSYGVTLKPSQMVEVVTAKACHQKVKQKFLCQKEGTFITPMFPGINSFLMMTKREISKMEASLTCYLSLFLGSRKPTLMDAWSFVPIARCWDLRH